MSTFQSQTLNNSRVKNIKLFPIFLVKVVKNLEAIDNIPICFPTAHYVTIFKILKVHH